MSVANIEKPTLYMANHPPFPRILGEVARINERQKVAFVVDAGLSGFVKFLGIDAIPVDTSRRKLAETDLVGKIRGYMVRYWGLVTHAYNDALHGQKLKDKMSETLILGRSVFICPTGLPGENITWKTGVGSIAMGTYQRADVQAAFIRIPNSYTTPSTVANGGLLGDYVFEGDGSPEVTGRLEAAYYQCFPSVVGDRRRLKVSPQS